MYIYARDQAFFKIQFFAGDRAGDLVHTRSAELLYSSNRQILLVNHSITKSLRDGSTNMFALTRYKNTSLCPVVAFEVYAKMCEHLGISIKGGYLFKPTSPSGSVLHAPFDSPAAQARLWSYVKEMVQVFGNRRVTLHGLRSGCAISLVLSGADMNDVMSHIGWKTVSTAQHYVKLHHVLQGNSVGDALANLDKNITEVYSASNALLGFTEASQ